MANRVLRKLVYIGCWRWRWTIWNWGDISHSPANRKATQTKEPPKYHSETRIQNLSCPLQMGQCHHRNPDPAGAAAPPVTWRQRIVMGDGWQVDGRFTGFLDCFPSKWVDSISAFPIDSQTRPPPAPIRGERDESELEPNTADFRVDHNLWGHWAFIRTARLLTLNWRIA